MSELSFDMIGLISALSSTGLLAVQNIYSKNTLKLMNIHHIALLSILSKLAWCFTMPFWFLIDGPKIDFATEVLRFFLTIFFFSFASLFCHTYLVHANSDLFYVT